jgi:hypothetical protein
VKGGIGIERILKAHGPTLLHAVVKPTGRALAAAMR